MLLNVTVGVIGEQFGLQVGSPEPAGEPVCLLIENQSKLEESFNL
jgi:hypothetical protein